jgi:FG-GAP repeat
MAFKAPVILTSSYESNGRFGTALSKLGDVNMDGFNDIAISAPFEGDGAVYIHLGGPDGVSDKPSQRLQAPEGHSARSEEENQAFFGHGMSRGVDIDSNGYRDIAVGAPNSEMVYIYKSYPVINVIASIQPSKTELSLEDTKFNIKVCAFLQSRTHMANEIGE